MYKDLSNEELEMLLEHLKRELIIFTKYYEKMKINDESYNAQVNLLLDDIKEIQEELKKRK